MKPIRARSLKFVAMLRANKPLQTVRKPLQTVCEPLQTLHKAEETFFAKYRIWLEPYAIP